VDTPEKMSNYPSLDDNSCGTSLSQGFSNLKVLISETVLGKIYFVMWFVGFLLSCYFSSISERGHYVPFFLVVFSVVSLLVAMYGGPKGFLTFGIIKILFSILLG